MEFNLNPGLLVEEERFIPLEEENLYDVLIIGGGPAGLTAAVYCLRKGVSTGIIFQKLGGQISITSGIENYMGYRYIEGVELSEKFREQVSRFGIGYEENISVKAVKQGLVKKVITEDGRSFSARAVIIASGKEPRRLGVPGEEEFTGSGVAYCSVCDAPFFKDRKVIVAGGGNSALESAIDLAGVASHVTIVQLIDRLTADKILVDKLDEFENIDILYGYRVTGIKGDVSVKSVVLENVETGDLSDIEAEGIFIEIGWSPNSRMVDSIVDINEQGEIVIDSSCSTGAEGIFAAGDVTSVPYKQIIIAAGEGAKAALSACDYLMKGHR